MYGSGCLLDKATDSLKGPGWSTCYQPASQCLQWTSPGNKMLVDLPASTYTGTNASTYIGTNTGTYFHVMFHLLFFLLRNSKNRSWENWQTFAKNKKKQRMVRRPRVSGSQFPKDFECISSHGSCWLPPPWCCEDKGLPGQVAQKMHIAVT